MTAVGWQSLDALVVGADLPDQAEQMLRHLWEKPLGLAQRTFELQGGELPPVPAAATSGVWTVMERPISAQWHGDELWLEGLYMRVSAAGASLIWAQQAAFPNPEVWMLALTEAHRAGGWLPLHAAAVAQAGRAVALTGVSGAGKSTALLRLGALGYDLLAEDRCFWHAPSGQVAGLDRYLRAFEDSLQRFAPQHLAAQPERDSKGKRLLPLPPAPAAQLCALLLLGPPQTLTEQRLSSPSHSSRNLSGAERVRALWDTTGLPLTHTGRQQVQRGLERLLPLLFPQTVDRETALLRVQAALETEAAP
ncbi:hypothetical protein Dxin01_02535 [Deinococcus xinjiangensis]|uniref:HPr kinase n=1 Tax=Deinococcus xinjiangensis TaxID=457454 RepID=A0ABP9VFE3_9DEIO